MTEFDKLKVFVNAGAIFTQLAKLTQAVIESGHQQIPVKIAIEAGNAVALIIKMQKDVDGDRKGGNVAPLEPSSSPT